MSKKVCVVGLGYVGFPTACVLANSGHHVIGVDTDDKVILKIKSNTINVLEKDLGNLFLNGFNKGKIEISSDIQEADVYIIAVQTPLNSNKEPDLSYINSAVKSIKPYIRTENLILIESTCPIGTTETLALELKANIASNLYVAYCPERVLPGNIIQELTFNNRIIGGIDEDSSMRAADFYKSFAKGEIKITYARMAEAVKLAENTYRDINIAYANELSMIAGHIGLNVTDMIELANMHPRVKILQPGPGVGGHCIAIDPYFLVHSSTALAELILKAREVNISKTWWVIKKIQKAAKENDIKTIACLGITYKPNVPDTRESAAMIIYEALKQDFNTIWTDPYIEDTILLYEAIAQAELIVLLVAHDEFLSIPRDLFHEKFFFDFTGSFK